MRAILSCFNALRYIEFEVGPGLSLRTWSHKSPLLYLQGGSIFKFSWHKANTSRTFLGIYQWILLIIRDLLFLIILQMIMKASQSSPRLLIWGHSPRVRSIKIKPCRNFATVSERPKYALNPESRPERNY